MPHLSRQAGLTLLESLVAVAILAVAVLGMLGAQLRTLADTQTSVRRAQAVRLIEDFAERIKTHSDGFRRLDAYVTDWDAMPAVPDCQTIACDPATLLQWDLAVWKQAIANTLPLGQGSVFESGNETTPGLKRQLGVMVAWRANERAADASAYARPFAIDPSAAKVVCPAGLVCHLVHVQP
jgi:type IV pilus assembly protein PilV